MNFSETAMAVFLGVFLAEMAVSVLRGQINIYKQDQRQEPYAEWYPSVEGYSGYTAHQQEGFAGPPLQAPPGYDTGYDESLYPAETRKFYY